LQAREVSQRRLKSLSNLACLPEAELVAVHVNVRKYIISRRSEMPAKGSGVGLARIHGEPTVKTGRTRRANNASSSSSGASIAGSGHCMFTLSVRPVAYGRIGGQSGPDRAARNSPILRLKICADKNQAGTGDLNEHGGRMGWRRTEVVARIRPVEQSAIRH
jgi:hypothetical protein